MKKIFLMFLITLLIFTAGCINRQSDKEPWSVQMDSSMGAFDTPGNAADTNPEKQIYNYKITLTYNGEQPFESYNVVPVINDKFSSKIVEKTSIGNIDHQTIESKGKIIIDTKDMAKQQIIDLGPVITAVHITWTVNEKTLTYSKSFE